MMNERERVCFFRYCCLNFFDSPIRTGLLPGQETRIHRILKETLADILLIQPPIRDFYLTAKRTIPYGLASIAAALENFGFSVLIFDALATSKSKVIPLPEDMRDLRQFYRKPDRSPFSLFYHYRHFGYSFEHLESVVRSSGAFLVGISSLFTPYADEAIRAAEVAKKALPNSWTVLGGHHPTALPETVMAHPAVDYVLRGEGEASLPMLAKCLQSGESIDQVPGIVHRLHSGGLHMSSPSLVGDLDQQPLPALKHVNRKYYRRNGQGCSVITASRGCPLKCRYCSVSADSYLTYRRRSVASVLGEMEDAVKNHQVRFIDFEDENLSLNRSWFMALMKGIINRFKGYDLELRAMNGLLPTTLDQEMLSVMKQAGFQTLNLSLCSISERNLRYFSRPDVSQAFDRVLTAALPLEVSVTAYIIVGAPGQDPMESVEDLLYLAEREVLVGVSVFYPSPGSKLFQVCFERDLLPQSLAATRSTALPVSDSTTRLDALTLLRLGRVLNRLNELAIASQSENRSDSATAMLLRRFLDEGVILGIDDSNQYYPHPVSQNLVEAFRKGLIKRNLPLLKRLQDSF